MPLYSTATREPTVRVDDYGTSPDGKVITDGAITSGASTFTSAAGGFTSAMTGYSISIAGAGAAAAALITTVTFVNATTLTTAATASTTVTGARAELWLTDNRVAVEAAMAALVAKGGGTLQFGRGNYVGSIASSAFLNEVSRNNIQVQGMGIDATILTLIPGSHTGNEHIVYSKTAKNFAIRNLTLDGAQGLHSAVNASQQNHCIQVEQVQGFTAENVRFWSSVGDGIRFLGGDSASVDADFVQDVVVTKCRFENFGRCGISIQRGQRHTNITGNTFNNSNPGGNNCIDIEPSSVGSPTDTIIMGNVFTQTNGLGNVQIEGISATDTCSRVKFIGNILLGGTGLTIYRTDHSEVAHNYISAASGQGAIRGDRPSQHLSIHDNHIVTTASSGASVAAIYLTTTISGTFNDYITIANNDIELNLSGGLGIWVETPGSYITVENNRIIGGDTAGASVGIQLAIQATGPGLAHYGWVIRDNTITNAVTGILASVRDGTETVEGVIISGNHLLDTQVSHTMTTGISVPNATVTNTTTRWATDLVVLNNVIGAEVTTPASIGTALKVAI